MKFKFLNFGKNKVHVRLHETDIYFKYDPHLLQLQVTGFKCKFVKLAEYSFETKKPKIWENGKITDRIAKKYHNVNRVYVATFLDCIDSKHNTIMRLNTRVSNLGFDRLKDWLLAVETLMIETTRYAKEQLYNLTALVENKSSETNLDNWTPEPMLTDEEFERIKNELFGNIKI